MSRQFVRLLTTFDGKLLLLEGDKVPEVEHTGGLMQETANRLALTSFGLDIATTLLCKVSNPIEGTEIYYFRGVFDVPAVPVKRLMDMGAENRFAAKALLGEV